MGSSKGNLYSSLHPKLVSAITTEWEGLDGTKAKPFFSELMGVKSYNDLYDLFVPGPHQDAWNSQDYHKHGYKDKKVHARAISYMDSWRRDLFEHYEEDEINTLSIQKNRVGKWLAMSNEIDMFLQPQK